MLSPVHLGEFLSHYPLFPVHCWLINLPWTEQTTSNAAFSSESEAPALPLNCWGSFKYSALPRLSEINDPKIKVKSSIFLSGNKKQNTKAWEETHQELFRGANHFTLFLMCGVHYKQPLGWQEALRCNCKVDTEGLRQWSKHFQIGCNLGWWKVHRMRS